MGRFALTFAVALGVAVLSVRAQVATKPGSPESAAGARGAVKGATADRSADEKAIGALVVEFVKAFDGGDAKAAAGTYTDTAVVVDDRGGRTEGREAIERLYTESFAENAGSKLEVRVDVLRFLGPETALESGRAIITPADGEGAPEITRFTAIYVKQDGRWLQAAVRDEPAADIPAHERLKELEWLIGEWVNESHDAVVFTTCKWAHGGSFLDREFTMKIANEPVLSGTQRIGWDPLTKQFKTWIFDSEGGHGEGFMTHDGGRWVIKVVGVNEAGEPASATNIVTRLGKDRISWQSVDRTLGGATIPGIVEFVVVRKPPEVAK